MAVKDDVCSCCREELMKKGENPRRLERLPQEVTQHRVFDRKGLPVRLCSFCDGDALPDALKAHDERKG